MRHLKDLSSRARKLLGFLSAALAGLGLAVLSNELGWSEPATMFAGMVLVVVLTPLILPFMMGPLTPLPENHPDYAPRGSLWRLMVFLPAPLVALGAYLAARPAAEHWANAGMVAVWAGIGYLFLSALLFLRPRRRAAV